MSNRRVIALLVNNAGLRDDYQGTLRRGVETACAERDLDLWVYAGRTDFSDSHGAQLRVFDLLSDTRIDGIVVAAGCIATGHSVEALFEEIRARCDVPICAVGQECAGIPSIVVDNRRGSAELGEHLITRDGKRRFAYIGGPAGHQESEQRLAGYRDALARHGLTLPDEAVRHGDFMELSGAEAMRQLIAQGQDFDAVVAANDHMARGAREVLLQAGLRCPEDVAVAGFDDARNARVMRPALTTVRQPVARMGALAVARLIAAWGGRGTDRTITLSTDLVVRESCGCHAARSVEDGRVHDARRPAARAQVAQLLSGVVDDASRRSRWARTLCAAIDEPERAALAECVRALLADLTSPFAPLHELHRVLSGLKGLAEGAGSATRLGASFDEAWSAVSSEAARRDAERGLRHEALLEELRISAEQFATTLTLKDLAAAMTARLPRFGIQNAVVSLLSRTTPGALEPLVVLVDGRSIPVQGAYRAELLLPAEAAALEQRASLTVMPLTFKVEQLGVAVLDLPSGYEVSTLLREQISGAIKTVALHEERLQQQRAQAQAQEDRRVTAERLRSLHLVAGGVAHDLNNALGPMLALPDAILMDLHQHREGPITPDVFEDLETIRHAGERAAHTIRDLSALGQPLLADAATLDLNRLLKDERDALRSLCDGEAGIVLRVVSSEQPLLVRATKSHLVRAVSNLVLNAIDAIQNRGVITVRAYERTLSGTLDGLEPVDAGQYAVVEVEDTGVGIPAEHLSRVLEPFFTSRKRPSSKGTGLGLTIVQRIVKDCGGYLRVESEVGKGTVFALYFPAQAERASAASHRPPPVVGGCGRILVVDDEDGQLRTARLTLTQLGYDVVTAQSGEAALDVYAKFGPQSFDLVVLDVVMPGGLDGRETLERLRALHPPQAVLMVSGWAPEQMDAISRDRGLAWLSKPYSVTDFAAAVHKALGPAPNPSAAPRAAS
jgi:DNA-binding LacI/PurR family transcriptional regulator/signal transduction histidine kinase/CheY-like chemotaxis protein